MLSDWQPQTTVVNGALFNYYRTPEQPGSRKPVLVLQHGFSDNGLCWVPTAQELAEDYDIIMPDARGHGRSARLTPGADLDQAADLAALLRGLHVEQAVVAGSSMGAKIVAELAARFPELVTAIILEDPPWYLRPPQPEQGPQGTPEESSQNQWFISLQDKSLEQVMAECRQEHPTWPEPYVRAWCQGKQELALNALPILGWVPRWQESVPAIRCPALLITADASLGGLVTPEVQRQVTNMNLNFRAVNFPGVGHHVRFAVHEAYMRVFKAFLLEVGRTLN